MVVGSKRNCTGTDDEEAPRIHDTVSSYASLTIRLVRIGTTRMRFDEVWRRFGEGGGPAGGHDPTMELDWNSRVRSGAPRSSSVIMSD
jgi:hypothetical protein